MEQEIINKDIKLEQERNLVCVKFPGVVNNDEKALQCLGGIRNISSVYSKPTKRLGLSFQPDNPLIKKIYGDNMKVAGVLFKVRVKKKKIGNEVKQEVLSTTVVGRVTQMYTFESMCDFQYMPVQTEGHEPQCILENMFPSGVDDPNFLVGPAPRVILPASYTRSDKPNAYSYTSKKLNEKKSADETNEDTGDVHSRNRINRKLPVKRFNFTDLDKMPHKPHDHYIQIKETRIASQPHVKQYYDLVQNLFEKRPIWSSNLIRYESKIKLGTLKMILPYSAFFMRNGPWRGLWVRHGYDPRKHQDAVIYQTLDFRIRQIAGLHVLVKKRDDIVHEKKVDKLKKTRGSNLVGELPDTETICEEAVYLKPGIVPAQRQIFYQYCDVHLPEVQEIINAEIDNPGQVCHPKRGWLGPNTEELCREHMCRYVKDALLATHQAELKLEQGSSDDEDLDEEHASSSDSEQPGSSNT